MPGKPQHSAHLPCPLLCRQHPLTSLLIGCRVRHPQAALAQSLTPEQDAGALEELDALQAQLDDEAALQLPPAPVIPLVPPPLPSPPLVRGTTGPLSVLYVQSRHS